MFPFCSYLHHRLYSPNPIHPPKRGEISCIRNLTFALWLEFMFLRPPLLPPDGLFLVNASGSISATDNISVFSRKLFRIASNRSSLSNADDSRDLTLQFLPFPARLPGGAVVLLSLSTFNQCELSYFGREKDGLALCFPAA